jgi:hypothetical protein
VLWSPVSTGLAALPLRSFNNGMTWLNGLWAGGKSANSDFATIAYQLQLLVSGGVAPGGCLVACKECHVAEPTGCPHGWRKG